MSRFYSVQLIYSEYLLWAWHFIGCYRKYEDKEDLGPGLLELAVCVGARHAHAELPTG